MAQRVAIVMYGLSRSLQQTFESIKQHLLDVLVENGYEYDIFIHTYTIHGRYENPWTGEAIDQYVNEDVEGILHPFQFLSDNQDEVLRDIIDVNQYYKKLGNWTGMTPKMTKYLIKNMCLALYSKQKITNVLHAYKDRYEYAIIMRPDLMLQTKIQTEWFRELHDSNIVIPEMHCFSGANDRICIGKLDTILYCGTLFDSLKDYSQKKSIVSEVFFMDKLHERGITILKKPIVYDTIRATTKPPVKKHMGHALPVKRFTVFR